MYALAFLLLLVPAVAFAQTSVDTESLDSLVSALVDAVQSDQWLVVAGLATTIIVLLLRRTSLLRTLSPKATPWVASAIAIASAIATSLISGMGLVQSITDGILVGAAASGFWELLFKHTRMNPKNSAPAEPATSAD